jgi:hypothetical protein
LSCAAEIPKNLLPYSLHTKQHVIIPEAHDPISLGLDQARAVGVITTRIRVLPTIELDDQATRHANEISKEAGDRILTTEFPTAHLFATQVVPQMALGVSGGVAQAPRAFPFEVHPSFSLLLGREKLPPPNLPLRAGGGAKACGSRLIAMYSLPYMHEQEGQRRGGLA